MTNDIKTSTVNTRDYEATFILDTRTYQEPIETLIERITSIIESIHGKVDAVQNQGQKAFARVTNRKFPAGIYVSFKISAGANFPKTLKERFKLDKLVNRILITVK